MKRIVLLLSLMAVMVALSATVAFAVVEEGTNGNDTMVGTADPDHLYGLRGNDEIRGLGSGDVLFGGAGNDTVYGAGGHDLIWLGSGHDTAYGGTTGDEIFGGPGDDVAFGEGGSDTIKLQDGVEGNDFASCGGGLDDWAYVDSADEVHQFTCEHISTDPPV
jgi:Ca2+-binding RTX toxin-like protein